MGRSLICSCLLITCAVVTFLRVTEGKSLQQQEVDDYCPPERTRCSFGCCPYSNGTCCSNGFHCCREGEVCGSEPGQCVREDRERGRLVAREGAPLYFPARATTTACPPCTTQCGEDKCCFFRDGTCCSDGLHCCPYRYSCDMYEHLCHMTVRNEVTNHLEGSAQSNATLPVTSMLRALDTEPYIVCPGGARCPTKYAQCCEEPDYGFLTCCYILGQARPTLHPLTSDYDIC